MLSFTHLMAPIMFETVHCPARSFIFSEVFSVTLLCAVTTCQLTEVSTNDLGQHPAAFAIQSELDLRQPHVLVVSPAPGTLSGRPVPFHGLKASRTPIAYANVHMFIIALSSGLPCTDPVICHSITIKKKLAG